MNVSPHSTPASQSVSDMEKGHYEMGDLTHACNGGASLHVPALILY